MTSLYILFGKSVWASQFRSPAGGNTHTDYNWHSNNSNLPSQRRRDLGKIFTNHHVPETTRLTQSIYLESSSNKSSLGYPRNKTDGLTWMRGSVSLEPLSYPKSRPCHSQRQIFLPRWARHGTYFASSWRGRRYLHQTSVGVTRQRRASPPFDYFASPGRPSCSTARKHTGCKSRRR